MPLNDANHSQALINLFSINSTQEFPQVYEAIEKIIEEQEGALLNFPSLELLQAAWKKGLRLALTGEPCNAAHKYAGVPLAIINLSPDAITSTKHPLGTLLPTPLLWRELHRAVYGSPVPQNTFIDLGTHILNALSQCRAREHHRLEIDKNLLFGSKQRNYLYETFLIKRDWGLAFINEETIASLTDYLQKSFEACGYSELTLRLELARAMMPNGEKCLINNAVALGMQSSLNLMANLHSLSTVDKINQIDFYAVLAKFKELTVNLATDALNLTRGMKPLPAKETFFKLFDANQLDYTLAKKDSLIQAWQQAQP